MNWVFRKNDSLSAIQLVFGILAGNTCFNKVFHVTYIEQKYRNDLSQL